MSKFKKRTEHITRLPKNKNLLDFLPTKYHHTAPKKIAISVVIKTKKND